MSTCYWGIMWETHLAKLAVFQVNYSFNDAQSGSETVALQDGVFHGRVNHPKRIVNCGRCGWQRVMVVHFELLTFAAVVMRRPEENKPHHIPAGRGDCITTMNRRSGFSF